MDTTNIRQEIIGMLEHLSDQQVATLLEVVRGMQPAHSSEQRTYDPKADILRNGIFKGPTDLAERVEEILEEESRKHGSWTIKDPD